ncbi:MAG: TetR/AcrR family transcriptional regulator [Burkholderiales bacterium]|nr:TetR/AcrR family transcriptional regulator [Burkholderiales bacterium]
MNAIQRLSDHAIRRLSKGEETRAQILDVALNVASESGFEALTIGSLAERTGLSKSGLFAHFGSKEDLQIAVLDEGARRVSERVFKAALSEQRGVVRLRALFGNWLGWAESCQLKGGCPIMAAAFEFDDRPGPVRDAVVKHHARMQSGMARTVELCIETGEFRPDTDPQQFAFEIFGIANAYYFSHRLMRDADAAERAFKAFDRLVTGSLVTAPSSATSAN